MKKIIFSISLFIVFVFLFSGDAFGGAWTVPKHQVWSELYFKWNWSKNDFNIDYESARKSSEARSWGWVMEPKIEFGVTDWLNFLCSLEYKESKYKEYDRPASWGSFSRKNNGISSVKLGGKIRFIEKPLVVSGQIKAFIYPGYGNYNGDDPAYRHQPSIGDGEDALEFRVLLGKEFMVPYALPFIKDKATKCYAGFETGYRLKNKNVCNDIPFVVEGGFWPVKWLLIKAEVDGYLSHRQTGSIEKDYAVWRVGPVWQILQGDSVAKQGKMFNVEFQYGQTFWGRNTAADQEIVFKIQTQF